MFNIQMYKQQKNMSYSYLTVKSMYSKGTYNAHFHFYNLILGFYWNVVGDALFWLLSL